MTTRSTRWPGVMFRQSRPYTRRIGSHLRCPASGLPLERTSDGQALTTSDGRHTYPVVDGVPILLDDERSVFSVGDYLGGGRAQAPSSRRVRVARRARGLAPKLRLGHVSERNYARLAELLAERASAAGRPARVLVVGGSVTGTGFEVLDGADGVELVETDVSIGPRTRLVCDAHQLPFADGTFDGAVLQAVLEHVADPPLAVSEVHRVLAPGALVYSEIPFMQQVHEAAYDFTRYTLTGHRRLFRAFDEIDAGPVSGPGTALAWSVKYFAQTLGGRSDLARFALGALATLLTFWLRYVDVALLRLPGARDAASATYFLGRRRDAPLPDREIVRRYDGAQAFKWRRA